MPDLDLATQEQIFEELKRRHRVVVLLTVKEADGAANRERCTSYVGGNLIEVVGITTIMLARFKRTILKELH